MKRSDVIIIGAGAAGLMCAIEAGKRKRNVVILDHANKAGKKILMSGGGRCNFTNHYVSPDNFISHNPHFCKSALSRYTQWDFIELVKRHQIPFHEKTLGQLFCDNKANDILAMLLLECEKVDVEICLHTEIKNITQHATRQFILQSNNGIYASASLVIASGGLSIPTMGASPFGYKIAEQFGLTLQPTRAGLVPLTLQNSDKETLATLSGISTDSVVHSERQHFRENILFTHRGLSGPAILQISSYWNAGEAILINLLPEINLREVLQTATSRLPVKSVMAGLLPKRVIDMLLPAGIGDQKISSLTKSEIAQIAAQFNAWQIKPNGTEGYRTAEVTLGGVDCNEISSKTFEANRVPGLYFIGEVLDVTGWLGGFNFQWAWSSGWAAGQVV